MFIYQDSEFQYKKPEPFFTENRSAHSLRVASSKRKILSLNKKNKEFLEYMGFKIKKVQGKTTKKNKKITKHDE